MKQAQKRLLDLFAELQKPEQETLLAFAEFLASRTEPGKADQGIAEPLATPRPDKETVVAAMKRLSATYFMLDKPELLNESAALMTQHVMQGREAVEVIDDLEALFRRSYEELQASHVESEG